MLSRSLSFRRKSQQANAEKVEVKPPPDQREPEEVSAAPTPKSSVQKVIRSVSFSRRSRKPPPKKEETASEESSESRPTTPEDPPSEATLPKQLASRRYDSDDMTDAEIDAVPLSSNLQGWLKKRHQKQPTQWARRFFHVNDTRGTVAYSKGEKGKRTKPSVVLSLQDISVVKLVELEDASNAFMISCPPVTLTAAAEDREEALMWVMQLNKRVRVWREKAGMKTKIAVVGITPPAAVAKQLVPRPAVAAAKVVRPHAATRELEPRPPVVESNPRADRCSPQNRQQASAPSSAAETVATAAGPAVLRPAILPVNEPNAPPPARALGASDVWRAGRERPRDATPSSQLVVRAVSESPSILNSVGRSTEEASSSVESIQAFESDEEGSPLPGNRGSSPDWPHDPWDVRPTRDLNDMFSSDEEEDDDGIYAPLPPAPVRRRCTQEQEEEPAPLAQHAPPSPAADERAEAKASSGPMSWLDAMPVEALQEDNPQEDNPVQIRGNANGWDSDADDDGSDYGRNNAQEDRLRTGALTMPPPPVMREPESEPEPEPELTHVGNGIVADSNFVDDDWDD